MKAKVLVSLFSFTLLSILLVGGALCGSCSAYDDWSVSQAGPSTGGAGPAAAYGGG